MALAVQMGLKCYVLDLFSNALKFRMFLKIESQLTCVVISTKCRSIVDASLT